MDKVRKRDMKLSDYNISRAKYNELKYFCMQYEEKKRELHKGYGLNAIVNDGLPKGNLPGNPVEGQAIRNAVLQADVESLKHLPIKPKIEKLKRFDYHSCGGCGRVLSVNDKYCPACGTKIKWETI